MYTGMQEKHEEEKHFGKLKKVKIIRKRTYVG